MPTPVQPPEDPRGPSRRRPSRGPARPAVRPYARAAAHPMTRGRVPEPTGVPGAGGPEAGTRVYPPLRTAAAHAWRLLVVAAAVYGVFAVLGRFHELGVAVFLGLVVTALLRPLVNLLARPLPRALAVAVSLLAGIVLVLGVLALVGDAVAGERRVLVQEFVTGVDRIERWLEGPPFRLDPHALTDLQSRIGQFLASHRSTLISTAISGAGRLVEVVTVFALALFSSVFFLYSGDRQWAWFCGQLPESVRPRTALAGRTAWRTFTGYTHGIVLVAATNAVLVGVALFLLGVPLALPLALLEFFAAFVPLIGSPIALAVAAVVALAAKGVVAAVIVVALIVLIGQLEGHVLHPLVMSWAVRLHPVVVAFSVIGGAIAAGVLGAVVAVPLVSVVWAVLQALRGRDAGGAGRAPAGR